MIHFNWKTDAHALIASVKKLDVKLQDKSWQYHRAHTHFRQIKIAVSGENAPDFLVWKANQNLHTLGKSAAGASQWMESASLKAAKKLKSEYPQKIRHIFNGLKPENVWNSSKAYMKKNWKETREEWDKVSGFSWKKEAPILVDKTKKLFSKLIENSRSYAQQTAEDFTACHGSKSLPSCLYRETKVMIQSAGAYGVDYYRCHKEIEEFKSKVNKGVIFAAGTFLVLAAGASVVNPALLPAAIAVMKSSIAYPWIQKSAHDLISSPIHEKIALGFMHVTTKDIQPVKPVASGAEEFLPIYDAMNKILSTCKESMGNPDFPFRDRVYAKSTYLYTETVPDRIRNAMVEGDIKTMYKNIEYYDLFMRDLEDQNLPEKWDACGILPMNEWLSQKSLVDHFIQSNKQVDHETLSVIHHLKEVCQKASEDPIISRMPQFASKQKYLDMVDIEDRLSRDFSHLQVKNIHHDQKIIRKFLTDTENQHLAEKWIDAGHLTEEEWLHDKSVLEGFLTRVQTADAIRSHDVMYAEDMPEVSPVQTVERVESIPNASLVPA